LKIAGTTGHEVHFHRGSQQSFGRVHSLLP
jgi:hypothetical protein